MMNIKQLMARDIDDEGLSATHMALIVSLLVLVLLGMILVGALMFLRNMRHARKQAQMDAQLPLYEKRQSGHNRLTITAMPFKGRDSVVVYSEKEQLMRSGPPSPSSPVPEIRITFPDEVDDAGKRQSGRVVVVRVGEHSVGLEPVQEDLPPYQRDASDRFDSLDLDRIGGLKEKDSKYYS